MTCLIYVMAFSDCVCTFFSFFPVIVFPHRHIARTTLSKQVYSAPKKDLDFRIIPHYRVFSSTDCTISLSWESKKVVFLKGNRRMWRRTSLVTPEGEARRKYHQECKSGIDAREGRGREGRRCGMTAPSKMSLGRYSQTEEGYHDLGPTGVPA